MEGFFNLLFFSALIAYANLAPTALNLKESYRENLIRETLELSKRITKNSGKDGKVEIVSEEFNRENPQCLQKHVKTLQDGLHKDDQPIISNLEEIAVFFNDSSCLPFNEISCNTEIKDYETFKAQLIQFLKDIPSNCQNLESSASKKR